VADMINEKTSISLSISSWWHVVVIVGFMVACYYGLEARADEAVRLSQTTAAEQKTTQEKVNSMQMDIRSVADDVKWFRQQYERDMSRYVRDTPAK